MIAEERRTIRWTGGGLQTETFAVSPETLELVACEHELEIALEGKPFVTLSCSPEGEKELVIGFLKSEGVVSSLQDIDFMFHNSVTSRFDVHLAADNTSSSLHADAADGSAGRVRTSGCGNGVSSRLAFRARWLKPLTGQFAFTPDCISRLAKLADIRTESHRDTGCLHHAVLVFEDGHSIMREDIGRHNAVDKAIGTAMLAGLDVAATMLISSGRLSSEIIFKAAAAGIPLIISRAATTTAAIDAAHRFGVTIIGFSRGTRFTVYTHPERIVREEHQQTPGAQEPRSGTDSSELTQSTHCDLLSLTVEVL